MEPLAGGNAPTPPLTQCPKLRGDSYIVMMTRGPEAKIAELLDVPFPRLRHRETRDQHPAYHKLKAEMELHLSHETRAVEESRIRKSATIGT